MSKHEQSSFEGVLKDRCMSSQALFDQLSMEKKHEAWEKGIDASRARQSVACVIDLRPHHEIQSHKLN